MRLMTFSLLVSHICCLHCGSVLVGSILHKGVSGCLLMWWILSKIQCFLAWQDGAPPLGWGDTVAYLVLPVLLIGSQYVSMQLMQPPQVLENVLTFKSVSSFRFGMYFWQGQEMGAC
jgi:hypothetical protein